MFKKTADNLKTKPQNGVKYGYLLVLVRIFENLTQKVFFFQSLLHYCQFIMKCIQFLMLDMGSTKVV